MLRYMALCLSVLIMLAPSSQAQSNFDTVTWENIAARAENIMAQPEETSRATRTALRDQLSEWREHFDAMDAAIAPLRVVTLQQQIEALGTVPKDGAVEAPQITARRMALIEQLAVLEAPQLEAREAFRRATGLIAQIDAAFRQDEAKELFARWPSPFSPENWVLAGRSLLSAATKAVNETQTRMRFAPALNRALDNLPLLLLLGASGVLVLWRGKAVTFMIVKYVPHRNRVIMVMIRAIATIILPSIGVCLIASFFLQSGLLGASLTRVVAIIPQTGLMFFAFYWLSERLFPQKTNGLPVTLSHEERATGRLWLRIFITAFVNRALIENIVYTQGIPPGAHSVINFAFIFLASAAMFQIGRALNNGLRVKNTQQADDNVAQKILQILGRLAVLIGVLCPIFAAIGYIELAAKIIFPAALSFSLIGLMHRLQRFILQLYALLPHISAEDANKALGPVLIGFAVLLGSLPIFALIWGARVTDLKEFGARITDGFQLGSTQISPTNFLLFAAVFATGYMATRLFQASLKNTILPRTKMDSGARNALTAGTGYAGIFISALVAIKTAGIDLSGLAIVAGALSVGIGFGLQNIVSNFVSGIILLIERPISIGDWVQVGTLQGTVKSISVRSTRIETFDRTDVIVPNTDLVAGHVTNWTGFGTIGRVILPLSVAYGSDTEKVDRILREIALQIPNVLKQPAPQVIFSAFGADGLNFELRVFLFDINSMAATKSALNHKIAARFAEEEIVMPFTQREITIKNLPQALPIEDAPQALPIEDAPQAAKSITLNEK